MENPTVSELEGLQDTLLQQLNLTSVETEASREKDVFLNRVYCTCSHVALKVLPQTEGICQICEEGGYGLPVSLSRRVERRDKGGGGLWKVPPGIHAHRRVLLGMIPCHSLI